MKKQFTILLILILSLIPVNFSDASDLAPSLKGKILLRVENAGQAWYVDPDTEERAYLGRPDDAFNIMRELGLGISEEDFQSFNGYVPENLSGKILLRVEANGEAYYVSTNDYKMYYLGRPADAFKIMREQGLGITDVDLNKVPIFEKYKEQVEKNTEAINELTQQVNTYDNTIEDLKEQINELQEQESNFKPELEPEEESTPKTETNEESSVESVPEIEEEYTYFSVDYYLDINSAPSAERRCTDSNIVIASIKITSYGADAVIGKIVDHDFDEFIIKGSLNGDEIKKIELTDKDTGIKYNVNFIYEDEKYKLNFIDDINLTDGITKRLDLVVDLFDPVEDGFINCSCRLQAELQKEAFSVVGANNYSVLSNVSSVNCRGGVFDVLRPSLLWNTQLLNNESVTSGKEGVVIYSATLNPGKSLSLTSIKLNADESHYQAFDDLNIASMDLYINGNLAKSVSGKIVNDGLSSAYINFSSLNTINRQIDCCENVLLEIRANFSSSFTTFSGFSLRVNEPNNVQFRDADGNSHVPVLLDNSTSKLITLVENK